MTRKNPRRLQENATIFSWVHSAQRRTSVRCRGNGSQCEHATRPIVPHDKRLYANTAFHVGIAREGIHPDSIRKAFMGRPRAAYGALPPSYVLTANLHFHCGWLNLP